jgi:mono/diheme cytochrome c family protein
MRRSRYPGALEYVIMRLMVCLQMVLLCAVACGPTTYPADVFPEMHYSPADRRGEPPRAAPPVGAVPISGSTPQLSYDDATSLTNPVAGTPDAIVRGQELARVNCAACHGSTGHGDGPVAGYFSPVRPVDFASQRVRNRTDGQLFWIITNGLGNMPAFRDLLSEQDLWTVVLFVRSAGGSP